MIFSSPHLLSSSKAFLSPKGNLKLWYFFLICKTYLYNPPWPYFVLLFCAIIRDVSYVDQDMRQNPYLSSRNTDTLTHLHSFCSGLAKLFWWFECDTLWRFKISPCPEAVVVIGQKNVMMAYNYDEFIATVAKGRNSDSRKKSKQVTGLQWLQVWISSSAKWRLWWNNLWNLFQI